MRRLLALLLCSLALAACLTPSRTGNPQPSRASRTPPFHIVGTGGGAQGPSTHHRHHHHDGSPHHHPKPNAGVAVPAVDRPRRWLTPGVTLTVGTAQICRPGYASSVRDVPDTLKAAVYRRYGLTWVSDRHEIDHLISLELGGSNSIRNLWPEPYAGRWGARTKDVVENRLHDLVCAGQLSLASAQHEEATNWVAAYRRYVGTPPSGSGGAGSTSAGGYYASRYPTADTIYCADDPEWRNLSPAYLVHLATWAQAHARFPGYHLHQPC